MGKAAFYYKQLNAPAPNKPNHIGSTILINYNGKVLLESRKDITDGPSLVVDYYSMKLYWNV